MPTEIGLLGFLSFTRINGNEFTGTLHTELRRRQQVSEFWFHRNRLTGTIPTELGRLQRMLDLCLFGNRDIMGTIPEVLFNYPRLLRLDLHEMSLTGTLSTNIGRLGDLEQLRVSRNMLTGTIPTEIGNLSGLRLSWLHLNFITGSLPLNICDNVGPDLLEFLQTDCGPDDDPAVPCLCCSACCERSTNICSAVGTSLTRTAAKASPRLSPSSMVTVSPTTSLIAATTSPRLSPRLGRLQLHYYYLEQLSMFKRRDVLDEWCIVVLFLPSVLCVIKALMGWANSSILGVR